MKLFLFPFSALFAFISKTRNWAFDNKLVKTERLSVPVVSIGNLSVGGTGKTPLTVYLIELLKARGLKVGIISRGYGGTYPGIAEVDLFQDWKIFGDEPVMMKLRLGEVPIFLAPRRIEAGRALLNKHSVDLIVADDAFQHRYLKRDLDLVLLDGTQPENEYRWLPWGRLRESFSSLKRADWVILTKLNLLPEPEQLKRREFLLSKLNDKKVLTADLIPTGLYNEAQEKLSPESIGALFLLSGIGRPEAFKASVEKYFGRSVETHWSFKDHHEFCEQELASIFAKLGPDDRVVTTEKDFVRIRAFSKYKSKFLVFKVDMILKGSVDEFLAQVTGLVL